MQFYLRSILVCLSALVLAAMAGCGGGNEASTGSPPTAIGVGGSEGGGAQDEGPTSPTPTPGSPRGAPFPDPLHPIVLIETSLGDVKVRLDAEKTPLTVDNFLAYVDRRHYDGTIFHQVFKDYPRVVIGGAYTADLTEQKPQTPVRNEAHNGLENRRGTIAMARQSDAIDSATCHFFFNLTDNQKVLDHKDRTLEGYGYCVFGEVIEGMDVVDKIGACEVHDTGQFEQIPIKPVVINSIRRFE